MVTERGRWKIWQRVVAVPAGWIAQALLQLSAVFLVGIPIAKGRPEVAERMISLTASLPVVILDIAARFKVSIRIEPRRQ